MMLPTLALATEGYSTAGAIAFWALALLAGVSALTLVITRNIVRAAVGLLFTLAAVAGVFLMLSAEFLAAVQIVVYVGGTLVLIIFGVMLTTNSPFAGLHATRGQTAAALAIGAAALVALFLAIRTLVLPEVPVAPSLEPSAEASDTVRQLGLLFIGPYLLVFELASVVLLVVMIGAAHLARGRTPDDEREDF